VTTTTTRPATDRLDPVVAEFRQQLQDEGKAPLTVSTYTNGAQRLARWATQHGGWVALTTEVLQTELRAMPVPATRRWYAGLFRSFGRFLARRRVLEVDPAAELRQYRTSAAAVAPKALTVEEDEALRAIAAGRGIECEILHRLLRDAALRVREVVGADEDADTEEPTKGLRVRDVNTTTREIRLVGKGRVIGLAFLDTPGAARMALYLSQLKRGDADAPLFQRPNGEPRRVRWAQRTIRRCAVEAGILRHVTPHMLRHTFATAWLRADGDLESLRLIMRHKHLATVQAYLHLSNGALRRVFDRTVQQESREGVS
jgi:integrase/recombinase XerC